MENFGCFRDRKVVFEPGFNQVIGANESGKSTVIKALFTVLFEDGTTKKKHVASWSNWSGRRPFRLDLEFSVGDKDFSLIRDYGIGRDMMTDSDGITYEGKSIREKLSHYFGTSDRSLFESIFCFTSDNPNAPESNKDRLQTAIETPVFFGFERGRADHYLDEEIKKLENPRAHGPRELDIISDHISNRLQEKSELDKRLEELNKNQQELNDVRDKLQDHEQTLERLEKETKGGEAYQDVNNRMINLEERLQVHLGNHSRASQIADDLARIDQEVNRLDIPDDDEMAAITVKGNELNCRIEESRQAMDILISRRKKANRGFVAATLVLVVLCLAYVFQQNGYIESGPVVDSLLYTIPIMALVWLSRMGGYLYQFYKKKQATAYFRKCIGQADELYVQLNNKYHLKAAEPIKTLEEAIQRRQALEMSADNLRNTIDALSENKGLDYLNQVREQLEKEVAQLNQELAPLTGFARAANKLADLKEEMISRRVRANALRERAALLTERCSVIEGLQKSLNAVENQVEILKRKHNEITERLEILKITRNALNRAADKLIEDTFEAYSASCSSFLSSLTGGRYNQLRFNRESGRFEVKVTESNSWLHITDSLSSSTRDCIYLALRLAAVALLSSDFCSPVIFDQAETRMDDARRKAFFDLLQKSAQQRQIIYTGLKKAEPLLHTHLIEFEKAEINSQPISAT
jgi:uncharacterized protein YhaN